MDDNMTRMPRKNAIKDFTTDNSEIIEERLTAVEGIQADDTQEINYLHDYLTKIADIHTRNSQNQADVIEQNRLIIEKRLKKLEEIRAAHADDIKDLKSTICESQLTITNLSNKNRKNNIIHLVMCGVCVLISTIR